MRCNSAPHERSYTHSVPFDVHTWSDHPESNTFVDRVFADHVEGQWIPKDQKSTPKSAKHYLKVLLLHLYVVWKRDRSLSVSVSMRPKSYKQDRYNALHISRNTPNLIHHLKDRGVIGYKKGWKDYGSLRGYQSIIWPEACLIDLFEHASPPAESVTAHRNIELVRVKDRKSKRLVDYDDNELTTSSREVLRRFNDLLDDTQIALDGAEPVVASKLCYRTFTRDESSEDLFALGGRIYGGWWQQEGSAWRDKLTINGNQVVELDYHSLHPRLLYALVGQELKHDPYQLNSTDRNASKLLFLTAINARDESSIYQAFRHQSSSNSRKFDSRHDQAHDILDPDDDPANIEHILGMMKSFDRKFRVFDSFKSVKNSELKEILQSLKQLNEPIARFLCNDMGIRLQRTDSDICMKVIEDMTGRSIPVLPIHDSFIVEKEHEEVLREVMERSALEVVGLPVRVDLK